ncbi:uncharacterized protein LAESUDRAFT_702593, partial [Laetiporus sulphureus 93-53]
MPTNGLKRPIETLPVSGSGFSGRKKKRTSNSHVETENLFGTPVPVGLSAGLLSQLLHSRAGSASPPNKASSSSNLTSGFALRYDNESTIHAIDYGGRDQAM